jgi:hypothetical protein
VRGRGLPNLMEAHARPHHRPRGRRRFKTTSCEKTSVMWTRCSESCAANCVRSAGRNVHGRSWDVCGQRQRRSHRLDLIEEISVVPDGALRAARRIRMLAGNAGGHNHTPHDGALTDHAAGGRAVRQVACCRCKLVANNNGPATGTGP